MSIMLLETTAALFSTLLNQVWSGSMMPGTESLAGSLVSSIELS
ncbi:hypothetical protein BDB13_2190 [Rhodococcus sp. OK302]|nr:hypothetical protein BDB13_2190 [Rhodococcus sp. OK302]